MGGYNKAECLEEACDRYAGLVCSGTQDVVSTNPRNCDVITLKLCGFAVGALTSEVYSLEIVEALQSGKLVATQELSTSEE